MTLNWESTYAIALELRRQHKDINIEEVTLQQIYDWTIALSEFEDDPALANAVGVDQRHEIRSPSQGAGFRRARASGQPLALARSGAAFVSPVAALPPTL